MTVDEATSAFSALAANEQIRFLASFGHNLTIVARDTYEFQASGVTAPERLRAINEIQHRVLSSFLLVWSGPDKETSGDTWHPDLDAAIEEAESCFGIEPDEWHART